MHSELYADYYKHWFDYPETLNVLPATTVGNVPRTPVLTDEWSYNRGYAQALLDFGIMEMLPDEE